MRLSALYALDEVGTDDVVRLVARLLAGSNAPFIGLFGTVIGIIKAFHDLATASAKGPSVVMASLSEALEQAAASRLFDRGPATRPVVAQRHDAAHLRGGNGSR